MDALRVLGVKTGIKEVCDLLFKNLTSHIRSFQVKRIYRFLQKFQWTPMSQENLAVQFWVPEEHLYRGGKWVSNYECVIHDKDNLFTHRLHVLDKYYEPELLCYFSHAFRVAWVPKLQQYIDLYKFWPENNHEVTAAEMNGFWAYMAKSWDSDLCTQRTVKSNMTMVPAVGCFGDCSFAEEGRSAYSR